MSDLDTNPDVSSQVDEQASVRDSLVDALKDWPDDKSLTSPDVDDGIESVEKSENRVRDQETGRFLAKTDAAPIVDAPVKAPEITAPDKTSDQAQSVSTPDGPPTSWAADAKATWPQLPPAIQAAVIKREREASEGFRQKSEQIRRYEETLAPLSQTAQRYGLDPSEGLQRLLIANAKLEQNPVQAIAELARNYGVDLSQFSGGNQTQPQADRGHDPSQYIAPIVQEVMTIKQTLQAREMAEAQTHIETYRNDPKYPYFDEVREDMAFLIDKGKAKDLPKAYEMACRLNPEVFNKIEETKKAEAEAKRVEEAKTKSANARRASVSLKGSGPVNTDIVKTNSSVRDTLLEAMNGHRL